MEATRRKQHGIHYTPPELAMFLARQILGHLDSECLSDGSGNGEVTQPITILDPACGDGGLLVALVDGLRALSSFKRKIHITGFETDSIAVDEARHRLEALGLSNVLIRNEDFLSRDDLETAFDLVIANPPYVRTQVLGGAESQRLVRRFGLSGRVDLYQVFAVAISNALKPGGVMGLLTSNRFLTVKSGAAMRRLLRSRFNIHQIIDLGDSRLFGAAVLPVIVVGTKRDEQSWSASTGSSTAVPGFCRVATSDIGIEAAEHGELTLLEAIEDRSVTGEIETDEGNFTIQRGELLAGDEDSVWTLANQETTRWLATVRKNQSCRFGDLAEIKVGIKTTADAVFIRDQWDGLGDQQPESSLLWPLLTHHVARRWTSDGPCKSVLYPYDVSQSKRTLVDLDGYPGAKRYLESHRERLEGRRYVIKSGRQWFEIWVPHQPASWAVPKIVWPDISEQPRFFLDSSGAIVNGDCYWIKLLGGVDPDWLYLMLGVANSSVATRFYDTVFHNKLYAGRRRFMTQYVNEFPLPELESPQGRSIVERVKCQVNDPVANDEEDVERLVMAAFGF